MITYIPDMADQAVGLLLSQYQRAPRYTAWVRALVSGAQSIEDICFDLLVTDNPTDATGATLDRWGRVVGQSRRGLPDSEYGRFIEARSKAAVSESDVESVLELWADLTAESEVIWSQLQGGVALMAWRGTPLRPALRDRVKDFMEEIRPGGLSFVLVEAAPKEAAFRFDIGPGFDSGELARWL